MKAISFRDLADVADSSSVMVKTLLLISRRQKTEILDRLPLGMQIKHIKFM